MKCVRDVMASVLRRRAVRLAFALACAAVLATAPLVPRAQEPARVSITGVTLVDVVSGRLDPNRTVTIAGGTIESIADGGAAPPGARAIDGRGKFLIPGLWDMHAHHEGTGAASLPLYVAQGVTGTRDMGSALDLILALRADTASGRLLGPRIVAAGPILDDAPDGWPYRMRVRTETDGRAAVRLLKERGVDFIKVHNRTSREAYAGITDEAERLGLVVAGHLPTGMTFEEAAAAGQRSIEHLASFRVFRDCSGGNEYKPDACREFFTWLRDRGIWQTPTLASGKYLMVAGTSATSAATDHREYASPSLRALWSGNQQFSVPTPEGARELAEAADVAARATADLQRIGVGVLAGCDGLVPGFCVHDELELMVRGGMPPLAALQTATINPARYLGLDGTLGTIERGKRADLVLLDANPLEAIANTRRIAAVALGGRVLEREELAAVLTRTRTQFAPR